MDGRRPPEAASKTDPLTLHWAAAGPAAEASQKAVALCKIA